MTNYAPQNLFLQQKHPIGLKCDKMISKKKDRGTVCTVTKVARDCGVFKATESHLT